MRDAWVITIDGPAGVGKSTVARMLSERLGAVFLDTGAMYRTVTAAAMDKGVDLEDVEALLSLIDSTAFRFEHDGPVLRTRADGKDYTQRIREPEVTENVRHVACQGPLRGRLVRMQQDFANRFSKVVTEGRDQGTVVFPDAKWKFFLEADPEERARRRQKDFAAAGKAVALEELKKHILSRDASDINRSVGPLAAAADAIHIDTTRVDAEGVVEIMIRRIEETKNGGH